MQGRRRLVGSGSGAVAGDLALEAIGCDLLLRQRGHIELVGVSAVAAAGSLPVLPGGCHAEGGGAPLRDQPGRPDLALLTNGDAVNLGAGGRAGLIRFA